MNIPATILLLRRDKQREENIMTNCVPYLQNYRIQDAIDWKNKQDLISFRNKHNIRFKKSYLSSPFLLMGKIACNFSHMQAWEYQINNNISHMIIFEDDVKLNDNFQSSLNNIISEIPDDYDLIYLYVHPEFQPTNDDDPKFSIEGKKYINRAYPTWCRLAYILSINGAKKLFKKFRKNIYNSGDMMFIDFIQQKYLNAFTTKFHFINNIGQLRPEDNINITSNIWSSPKLKTKIVSKLLKFNSKK